MGVHGLWPWTKKHGYVPGNLILGITQLPDGGKKRVDLAGGFYPTIRWAYGTKSLDVAHTVVEKQLCRLGEKHDIVVYVDGAQAQEKEKTHADRAEKQTKALNKAEAALSDLGQRISTNQHITKNQIAATEKHLIDSFSWTPESRDSLVKYLRINGWNVVACETEADVQIAQDCEIEDIVVTRDSDFLGYARVKTIWRMIGRGRVLVYNMDSLLAVTKLTRKQLTVLCIVSQNDYSSNIRSLGPETNFKIVKRLVENDVPSMVQAYLDDDRVFIANAACQEDFGAALRVFHGNQQTIRGGVSSDLDCGNSSATLPLVDPCTSVPLTSEVDHACPPVPGLTSEGSCVDELSPVTRDIAASSYNSLREKFDLLREHVKRRKKQLWESKLSGNGTISGTWVPTHKPSQKYNRYRTPPPRHGKGRDAESIQHRNPYGFKTRTQHKEHDRPPAMVQLKYNGYKEPPATPAPITGKKLKPLVKSAISSLRKDDVLRALESEHPTVCLSIGSLQCKINGVLTGNPSLRKVVLDCIRNAVEHAWAVKYRCQKLIGMYIESIFSSDKDIQPLDRRLLDAICARIPTKTDVGSDENDEETKDQSTEFGSKGSLECQFFQSFMTFLYSGNLPQIPKKKCKKLDANGDEIKNKKEHCVAEDVLLFINRLKEMELLEAKPVSQLLGGMEYPPSALVQSTAVQVTSEIRKHYRNGTKLLLAKLQCQQQHQQQYHQQQSQQQSQQPQPKNAPHEIRADDSSIENFMRMNRLTKNSYKLCPLSPIRIGYVTFTERQLMAFFWRYPLLKAKLQEMAAPFFNETLYGLALVDVQQALPFGQVIKAFIADVDPTGLTSRQRGKHGFLASCKVWSLQESRDHVNHIRSKTFDPTQYSTKGYLLRGSIKSDGHQIQLLGFKLRELLSVRYRRFSDSKLPEPIVSTVGGTDYYLSEVRNIFKTPGDINRILGCNGKDVKVIGLDLGQTCVVGASLKLPDSKPSVESVDKAEVFHNQSVKTKAVMQPIFKLRRWMEYQKGCSSDNSIGVVMEGNDGKGNVLSIQQIESESPILRGPGSSIFDYTAHIENHWEALHNFYNGSNFRCKKHVWDARRAQQEEYRKVANELLKAVGGSIGARRHPDNKVVIAVGLSKFHTKAGLTSLDGSFSRFFIQLARSLDYVVVGVNEFYTSQKCPRCHDYVGRITLRRLHCSNCKRRYHRDEMAAANICNIVRSYLDGQGRPRYLQPVRADGSYPWDDSSSSSNSRGGSGGSGSGRTTLKRKTTEASTRHKKMRNASAESSESSTTRNIEVESTSTSTTDQVGSPSATTPTKRKAKIRGKGRASKRTETDSEDPLRGSVRAPTDSMDTITIIGGEESTSRH